MTERVVRARIESLNKIFSRTPSLVLGSSFWVPLQGLEGATAQSELPVVAIPKQQFVVLGKRNRPKHGVEETSLRVPHNDYATMVGDRGRA